MATDNLMPQSSTSVIKHLMLRSSTTGQGLTGKVHSDFSGKYNIAGGAEVTLSFSSGSAGDAYSSGKIVPLGLGKYAWHVPDAVFASLGNVSAVLSVSGGIDVHCEWLVVAAVRDTAAFGANTTTPPSAATISTQVASDLASAHGVGSWTTATGFSTPTNVSDAQTAILAKLPAALEGGRIAAALDSASIDAIWDEVLTGSTHNIASSAGRRLRQLADTVVLVDGVCDAASNAGTDSTGTITLEVGTTTACVGQAIRCENQVRYIASYDAGTRVAQLDRPWCVVPDAGDEYVIFNVRNPLVGLASLALAGSAAAAVNDINAVTDKIDTGLVLDGAVYQFTENMLELGPSGGGGGGGGDATLAKQEEILAALQGVEAIQVASPNVQGNLVLTQGDDYDGVANPRAQWNVTTDYTSGWTVRLTIRDKDDVVIYTNTGSVVSATVVAVTIAAPTGLQMTGCPGQWQGKFDVELTHSSGKKKTIALGVCYINEDQTR
jgi:hypothetical protein